MKFSEQWLREWANPDLDSVELAHSLTMAGHEINSVEQQGESLDGVVVAEVLDVKKHPDADRLSVCQVDPGNGQAVEVVCGAPNVYQGMKSPLASPGVRLPNGMELRKSKIRGVESNGMLCSAAELGLGDDSDGIIDLPQDAETGTALADFLGLPDSVLDADLTPNRGDCFSVLGIARDLAAMNGLTFTEPQPVKVDERISDAQEVLLEDPIACPRFAGRVIKGIRADAKSPLWMVERLRRSGIRAIHPVVDVTNYVMMELGQPLHAYDLSRLQGAIRPRFAKKGEKVTLLDEQEIELNEDTVIITDDSGPIGMAGIMGGLSTMVEPTTTDVFFEAAFWPQEVMAGRARSYGMHTDASMRFERGVDPSGQARAIDRASELLLQISGGEAGPLTDVMHEDHLPVTAEIKLRHSRLAQVLGCSLDVDTVTNILNGLGLGASASEDGWDIRAPSHRFDIQIEDDLVEEVARIYGYDNLPEATAIVETPLAPVTETRVDIYAVGDLLAARDYQEVKTYSFIDAAINEQVTGMSSDIVLANPISSEMSVMRGSLLAGMLAAMAGNHARQQERVRLFESGKSFHGVLKRPVEIDRIAGVISGSRLPEQWGEKSAPADFFDIKSDVEAILAMTGDASGFTFVEHAHPALQPGQAARLLRDGQEAGMVGKVHPAICKSLGIKKDVFAFELDAKLVLKSQVANAEAISKFPAIRRDLAVVVNDNIAAADIVEAARSAAPDLIKSVAIFDIYRGPGIEAGLKSVALGLILQESSRTLTDEDADSATDAAASKLKKKFAAVLRD